MLTFTFPKIKNKIHTLFNSIVFFNSLLFSYTFLQFVTFSLGDLRLNVFKFIILQSLVFVNYLLIVICIFRQKKLANITYVYLIFTFISILYIVQFTSLSTDLYRYIWDGIIFSNGYNPYFYRASDSLFVNFHSSYSLYPKMQWIHEYTVYPPFAQYLFYFLSISYKYFGLIGAKILMSVPVLVSFYALKNKLSPKMLTILLLNPFILFEVFNGAHLDNFLFLLSIIFIFAFYKDRLYTAAASLVFGVLTKVLPAMFVPLIIFKLIKGKKFTSLVKIIFFWSVLFILFYLPFLINFPELLQNFSARIFGFELSTFPVFRYISYVGNLEFNGSTYVLLKSFWEKLGLLSYAKILTLGLMFSLVVILSYRLKNHSKTELYKYYFIIGLVFLLLSPQFFPWYLLFITPAIFLYFNQQKSHTLIIGFFLLQFLLFLTYFDEYTLQVNMYRNLNTYIWNLLHIFGWCYVVLLLRVDSTK